MKIDIAAMDAALKEEAAKKLAAMTPKEREVELKRQAEWDRYEEELSRATIPLGDYFRDCNNYETYIAELKGELAEMTALMRQIRRDKVMQQGELMTANHHNKLQLEKLQAQEIELKAARARIDALIDANLKAQDMRRQLDQLTTQGDRIEKKVGEIDKHNQQAEAYLGVMPDHEELGEIRKAVRKHIDGKKQPGISNATAARIFKTFYPDPRGIYKKLTGHTIGNWLEAGMMKKTNFKIDETALASKMSFLQWIISNCHEVGIEMKLPKAANEILNEL